MLSGPIGAPVIENHAVALPGRFPSSPHCNALVTEEIGEQLIVGVRLREYLDVEDVSMQSVNRTAVRLVVAGQEVVDTSWGWRRSQVR
ncbi:hypothetical protein GCM10009690_31810 [Brevibacterium permense]|uniref:Uncharacterized protein n=1 Tax=Brevibacterium permense TaxID=234834 RepID=A0ABP4LKX8_9MICO